VVERVLARLLSRPELKVFVNIAGASLGDTELLIAIEERIRRSGIEAGRLGFEVTETTAVADLGAAQSWIGRLKALGCLFALDDFGVGFASFAYLGSLPVDFVKIDRSFVETVDSCRTNRAVVEAVRSVARAMGREVIAEGVERSAQADVLREIGIDRGQGYHWGPPQPPDRLP
jgi:EAL domain-containing protein (putative c-di-GMP-specific phosphodiesterase class I)